MKMLIPTTSPNAMPPLSIEEVKNFEFQLSTERSIADLITQWAIFVRKPSEYLTLPDLLLRAFHARADLQVVMNIEPLRFTSADELVCDYVPDALLAKWLGRPKDSVWHVLVDL